MKSSPSEHHKYLHEDKDPWMLAEEIPDIDFQFSEIWLSSFANDLERTTGRNYKKVLSIYNGFNLKFYYGEKDSFEFADYILKLIVNSPAFGKTINKKIRQLSDKLKEASRGLDVNILKSQDNKKLSKTYSDLDDLHTTLYTFGWLPNAVDMFHGNYTNYLKEILSSKLPADEVNAAMVNLSVFPEKSVIHQEHESFLKLVAIQQSGMGDKKLSDALDKHVARYFYLKHLWLGKEGIYTKAYFEKEIQKYAATGACAQEQLDKEQRMFDESVEKRSQLVAALALSKHEIQMFDIYAEFAVTKAYRREAQLFWAYKMNSLFEELSRRFEISVEHVRFMKPGEVIQGLLNGSLTTQLKGELTERSTHCAFFLTKGVDMFYYGKNAKKIEGIIAAQPKRDIEELTGQAACLGFAVGTVRIVNSVADMKKMKKGDILVSIATNAEITPALKKASAIVTEVGGITSHAAIISRELGIPCIIGTKIATQTLKDGDKVEVDANKGIVKILK